MARSSPVHLCSCLIHCLMGLPVSAEVTRDERKATAVDRGNTWELPGVTTPLMTIGRRVTLQKRKLDLSQLRKQIADLQLMLIRYEAEERKNRNKPNPQLHAGFAAAAGIRNQIHKLQQRLDGLEIAVANAIWLADNFPMSTEYHDREANDQAAEAFECNFRGRAKQEAARMNEWVSKKMNHRISDFIDASAIEPNTLLVLTNAVYFHANWLKPFEKSSTRPVNFTTNSRNRVHVPVMTSIEMEDSRYVAFHADGSLFNTPSDLPPGTNHDPGYPVAGGGQMIELPFSGTDITTLLVLTRNTDGHQELCEQLTGERIECFVDALDERSTNVLIPRFRLERTYDLTSPLRQMGMPVAFSDAADFSGMTVSNSAGIKIGYIADKRFVEVNEEDTEAAAATAATIPLHSGIFHSSFTATFKADRPFLFLIRDSKTGLVLFVGKVKQPSIE